MHERQTRIQAECIQVSVGVVEKMHDTKSVLGEILNMGLQFQKGGKLREPEQCSGQACSRARRRPNGAKYVSGGPAKALGFVML